MTIYVTAEFDLRDAMSSEIVYKVYGNFALVKAYVNKHTQANVYVLPHIYTIIVMLVWFGHLPPPFSPQTTALNEDFSLRSVYDAMKCIFSSVLCIA